MFVPADLGESARRSASRYRALRIVADRSEARARAWPALSALWPPDLSHVSRAGEIRLEFSRSGDARDAPSGHRADHRSAAFRLAGLAWRFSESGMAEVVPGLCPRL